MYAQFPQQQESQPFIATTGLHDDKFDVMALTPGGQVGYACRIIAETARRSARLDMGIEPSFRNIHSTYDLVHGNLPCACDWSQATIRSYVTKAKVPGSSTVVTGGVSGDSAKPRIGWPSGSRLSRFHRTKSPPCRYKGQRFEQTTQLVIDTPLTTLEPYPDSPVPLRAQRIAAIRHAADGSDRRSGCEGLRSLCGFEDL